MKTTTATFIQQVTVTDPETNAPVQLSVYKHDTSGGMFAIDSSFIEQNFEDEETPTVADPFTNEAIIELIEYEIPPHLF